jgi:hypothetical protein
MNLRSRKKKKIAGSTLDKVYVLSTLTLLVDHVGRDRMVVRFTTTCASSAYHH